MSREERFCVAGIFCFLNPGGVLAPSEAELGEIIGLCCRTGLSAVFSSCHVVALQPCETSRLGPPSRIADLGLFWAIHKLDTSQRVLLCREDRRSWNFLTGNGFGNRGW